MLLWSLQDTASHALDGVLAGTSGGSGGAKEAPELAGGVGVVMGLFGGGVVGLRWQEQVWEWR